MRRYSVGTISEGATKYFFIRDCETMEIVLLPSKYLKHKTKANRSPNTVKRAAFAICYYLEYLKEIPMEATQVYGLDYEKQNEHFVNFLHWLKAGNHKQEDNQRAINNGTCNASGTCGCSCGSCSRKIRAWSRRRTSGGWKTWISR